MDNKQGHLVIIQGVVNRLSQNSFLLKGWSVILVAALFALAAGNANILFIYLAYFPLIAFWLLDGYFLWQERLYRKLYDHVRLLGEDKIDFSMDTGQFDDGLSGWIGAAISRTLIAFHGAIFVLLIVVTIGLALQ